MKKIIKGSIIGVLMLSMVGCSTEKVNTTLSCSYSTDQSMLTVKQDLNFTIKEGAFDKAKLVNEIIYSDDYVGKYDEDALISSLEDQFSSYKSVDVEATNTGAIVTITLDIDEFASTASVSKEILSDIKEDDVSDIKTGLEDAGYVCK